MGPLFVWGSMNIDNYLLPDGASEALRKQNRFVEDLGDGISRMSGHDRGVPFRFWIETVKNEEKSKAARIPMYDEIEMIEWTSDRYNKPTERVKFLPDGLLTFDVDGECVGGRYQESFLRFKKGMKAPGLPLSKWGEMSDSEVATLADAGVYSVEQLAAMPRDKITSRYPQRFVDIFESAIQWVNGKQHRYQVEEQADEILELRQAIAKRDRDLEELKEMISGSKKKKSKEKEVEAA